MSRDLKRDCFYCTQCSIMWKLLHPLLIPPQRKLQEKLSFKTYITRFNLHWDFKSRFICTPQREIKTNKQVKKHEGYPQQSGHGGKCWQAGTHGGLSWPQIRLLLVILKSGDFKSCGERGTFFQPASDYASVPGLTGILKVAAPDLHHVFR